MEDKKIIDTIELRNQLQKELLEWNQLQIERERLQNQLTNLRKEEEEKKIALQIHIKEAKKFISNVDVIEENETLKERKQEEIEQLEKEIKEIERSLYHRETSYLSGDRQQNKTAMFHGTKALNIIGVCFFLIAFLTLGNYLYQNYMNDVIKGLSLFILSGVIVLFGELLYHYQKEKQLANVVSAIGIAGFYISVIFHNLLLKVMPAFPLFVLAIGITILSYQMTIKKKSWGISVIGLLGFYSVLCETFTLDYRVPVTLMIFSMLLLVQVVNLWIPKQNKFQFFIETLLQIGCFSLVFAQKISQSEGSVLLSFVYHCYPIFSFGILLYSFKKWETLEQYIWNQLLPLFYFLCFGVDFELTLYQLVLVCFYSVIKKQIFLDYIVIALYFILDAYKIDNWYSIFFASILIIHYYVIQKTNGSMLLKITLYISTIVFQGYMVSTFNEIELVMSAMVLFFFIYSSSKKNKNSKLALFFKYSTFLLVFYFVNKYFKELYEDILYVYSLLILIFLILIHKVELLKDKHHLIVKRIGLCVLMLVLVIKGIEPYRIYDVIALSILAYIVLALAVNKKFLESEKLINYRPMGYSFYVTFVLWMVLIWSQGIMKMEDFVSSLVFLIFGFLNLFFGIWKSKKGIQDYGLLLVIFASVKLIFYDLSSISYLVKIISFFIIGTIALVFSYYYNKKNKQDLNQKEEERE